jgi:TrpR-related protein YerC/YecD
MNKQAITQRDSELYEAILTLRTVEECVSFFTDLCTFTELQAMEQRYQVAVLLSHGKIYNDILDKTGASSATISRVNRSLRYGEGGYKTVFERTGVTGAEKT